MNYSQEQIEEANRRDLADFLWLHGEQLEKSGREYRWKRHDSVTIQGNRWYQHSRSRGGYPIEFVEEFYGKTFPEAVAMLLEDETVTPAEPIRIPAPEFHLPPKDEQGKEMRRYLLEERGLKPEIVELFAAAGDLYEETAHHNVVFVGRDKEGTPRYAAVRGTRERFRQDVAGSDKAFGFAHIGTNDRLLVFEAPIDLMSFASLFDTWEPFSLIALGGVSPKAMERFMTDHPNISEVFLCLDNDEAGQLASVRLTEKIPLRCAVTQLVPRLKDWNEVLCAPDETAKPYSIGFRREALPPELRDQGMLPIDRIPMLTGPQNEAVPGLDDDEYEKLERMEDEMMANDLMYGADREIAVIPMDYTVPIPFDPPELPVPPVDMICLNDVERTEVEWLWRPYIPFGKITAMLGNPGEGKTYTVMEIIAACTNRKLLPGMTEPLEPFNVIYQTAEDGLGDTVKPRLETVGADLTRVYSIDDSDSMVTLIDERVERAIRENHVRLCVFDPIQAFLGANVDMNRANEVRPIFAALSRVAERTGCAMIFIGHLNKANGQQSLQRGLGSIDIVAAMRSVLIIGRMKKDPDVRVMAHEKSSLATNGPSLAFEVSEEDGYVWLGECDATADELTGGDGKRDDPPKMKPDGKTAAAMAFMRAVLADGREMSCTELDRIALEKSIPARTMRDARAKMGNELISSFGKGHVKMFRLAG